LTPSSILVFALQGTGEVYSALAMGPEALKSFQKAQEILLGMGLNGVDQTIIASIYGNIGMAYDTMGQNDAAMEHYQKGLEIQVLFGN
jgi:tetratricopeptide (TPR) repeat protein